MTLLAALRPGDKGTIVGVIDGSNPSEAQRLEDIGFVAGTAISVERRAPLGDPTVYHLRGTRIALRKATAALIEVTITR